MNKKCPSCSKTISIDSVFCIHCGSDLRPYLASCAPLEKTEPLPQDEQITCSYCQKTSPHDSNFCVHCGKKLQIAQVEKPVQRTISKRVSSIFNALIFLAAIASIGGFIFFYVENKIGNSADKNPLNEEIIGNLYRNTKYKFRIKFPETWEIKKGDGPNILIKATNKNGSSINILVKDTGVAIGEIDKMMTLDEWAESVYEKFPDAKILLKKEISIDNRKAYLIKCSLTYKALDKTANSTVYNVALTNSNFLYAITATASSALFEDEKLTMETSISTFVIEN